MSKAILWIGFLLSIFFLLFGLFVAAEAKTIGLLFWAFIFAASGYRLFFQQGPK
jgi:hypothetical protein